MRFETNDAKSTFLLLLKDLNREVFSLTNLESGHQYAERYLSEDVQYFSQYQDKYYLWDTSKNPLVIEFDTQSDLYNYAYENHHDNYLPLGWKLIQNKLTQYESLFLDSSIFTAILRKENPVYVELAHRILQFIESGGTPAVTSMISLRDILLLAKNENEREQLNLFITRFPNLRLLPLDPSVMQLSAELTACHGHNDVVKSIIDATFISYQYEVANSAFVSFGNDYNTDNLTKCTSLQNHDLIKFV